MFSYTPTTGRVESKTTEIVKVRNNVTESTVGFQDGYTYDELGANTFVTYPRCTTGCPPQAIVRPPHEARNVQTKGRAAERSTNDDLSMARRLPRAITFRGARHASGEIAVDRRRGSSACGSGRLCPAFLPHLCFSLGHRGRPVFSSSLFGDVHVLHAKHLERTMCDVA
jgi:hypothetical protein